MRYCGRDFSKTDMARIRRIAGRQPPTTRCAISQQVCEALCWRKPDGGLKQMSCRVALLRMQRDGWVELPPPRRPARGGKLRTHRTAQAEPQASLLVPAAELPELTLEPVQNKAESALWNEYIDRYHYLGYQVLPGAQLRYFAHSEDRLLALFGFGAAAWKTAPRDRFIGWTPEQRQQHLHLVVNNARFLILPWVSSRHLASKLLGLVTRRLAHDWLCRYGYRPVLLETFVEKPRFSGTCYRAANWLYLGDTQGRGKLDATHAHAVALKSVWVYPLSPAFRQTLTA
jgi:hypothetical protein